VTKGKLPHAAGNNPGSFTCSIVTVLTELPRSQLWSVTCFRMDGRRLVTERCTLTPCLGTSCVLSKRKRGKSRQRITMFLQVLNLIIKLVLCNHRRQKKKGKRKVIPLQSWTGPEGFRRLKLPDFRRIGT